ncbi:hypothetical protein [Bacillus alkalicellulosilyticus]|uniref:hypothetical protein n=1 Tax=Alkalihalobacterium alkalicellulosilyticum TaxID=1912214 RepID=UPI0009971996|nr:hypothetical protein [Bacillus alkalicellulosilyticus]
MRKFIASIVAVGVTAAAYRMSNRKTQKKMDNMLKPLRNIDIQAFMPERSTMKRMRKQFTKTFA